MNIDELIALKEQTVKPITVTHCGSSSKCKQRFEEAKLRDTIANKMVLSIGCNTKSDDELAAMGTVIDKVGLDVLHLWKIDESDEVLILDITDDGKYYIGESAARELEYARRTGKRIRFYSQE